MQEPRAFPSSVCEIPAAFLQDNLVPPSADDDSYIVASLLFPELRLREFPSAAGAGLGHGARFGSGGGFPWWDCLKYSFC